MLPRISSEGIGVAPPANDFSVVTSAGELLYGTISAHLSRVPSSSRTTNIASQHRWKRASRAWRCASQMNFCVGDVKNVDTD